MGMDGNPVGEGDGAVGRVSEGGEGSDSDATRLFPRVNAHFHRYRFTYEALGPIVSLLGIAIAAASVLIAAGANQTSREALQQSKEANEMTQRALKQTDSALVIQSAEFYVRNRPFVNVPTVSMANAWIDNDGKKYEHSVVCSVMNASEFPATRMAIRIGLYIGDRFLCGAESFESSVGPSQSMPVTVGLAVANYERFSAAQQNTHIKIRCDYGGLLQAPGLEYTTYEKFVYYPEARHFRKDSTFYR